MTPTYGPGSPESYDLGIQARIPARYLAHHAEALSEISNAAKRSWISLYKGLETTLINTRTQRLSVFCAPEGRNNYGRGKTQMLCSLLVTATAEGISGRYTTARDYFAAIKDGYDSGDTHRVIQEHRRFRILCLDEVNEATEHEVSLLAETVGNAYDYGRSILMATNYTAKEFTKVYGPRVVDRVNDCGAFHEFTWASFRGNP